MPYIANVYSLPPGSTATPNTTIESAKYNTLINDLATAQNTARPVLGGGTGGQTAVAGNDGLNTQGADIASGTTTNLAAATGVYLNITGTTTINSFGTVTAGAIRQLTFTGILTITHNATSMILPGAANITTAAGDSATFRSLGSGNWKCVDYQGATIDGGVSSTDNAIARFNGTSGALQNSGATIDDGNNFSIFGNITSAGGSIRAAAGSAAAPSFSFAADPDTGIFLDTTNNPTGEMGFTMDGTYFGNMTASGFNVGGHLSDPTAVGVSIQKDGQCFATASAQQSWVLNRTTSDGTVVALRRQNVTVGTISVTGAATAYNTSSDKRLKSELREFDSGAILDALSFGEFTWLKDGTIGHGVLAQDAEKVYPEAISQDGDGYYVADYSKFVAVLAAEMKALRKRVAELEDLT